MFAEKSQKPSLRREADRRESRQEGRELISPEQGISIQRENFLKNYPLAAQMVKNIQINDSDPSIALISLKDKFMESGFIYTMAATHPDAFLKGMKKEGDCSTLAKAYAKIAQDYFGIKTVKVRSKTEDFFVPGGGKVLDQNNARGNVNNGEHWAFTSHYWVDTPIGSIDLLFLGKPVNESSWEGQTGNGEEDGIEYRDFGDYRVHEARYTGASIANRYATDLADAKAEQKASEKEMAEMAKPGKKSSPSRGSFLSRLFG
ncbi:MAG: hypothetical protein GFH24_608438n49 [Chloroflexi bacterium AL-N5]|nr:hypothetical protein [Chloroflexi bacterium AL-N5]